MKLLHYLREAFWLRIPVPLLGDVPVNALAVTACAILGVGFPPLWLAGLGLEIFYLTSLAFNPRFQNWVDAKHRPPVLDPRQTTVGQLEESLAPARRKALDQIRDKMKKLAALQHKLSGGDDLLSPALDHSLGRIDWVYLKLLIAEQNIAERANEHPAEQLRQQIAEIQKNIDNPLLSENAREIKRQTLAIHEQRLELAERRAITRQEIHSSLNKIEAQLDLAIDRAGMSGGQVGDLSRFDLELGFLSDDDYGTSEHEIKMIEKQYAKEKPQPASLG